MLEDGSQHRPDDDDPSRYEVQRFASQTSALDPKTVFPDTRVVHRAPEMTIAELRTEIASKRAKKLSAHNEIMFIHQKFSIPVACLVFGLLALVLGVSNSKDCKNASFVVGLAVVFVYWMLMYLGQATARAHWIPAELAMWIPDIGLGLPGIGLLIWRHRHADAGVQINAADCARSGGPRAPDSGRSATAESTPAVAPAKQRGRAGAAPRHPAPSTDGRAEARRPRGSSFGCRAASHRASGCSTPTSRARTSGC